MGSKEMAPCTFSSVFLKKCLLEDLRRKSSGEYVIAKVESFDRWQTGCSLMSAALEAATRVALGTIK